MEVGNRNEYYERNGRFKEHDGGSFKASYAGTHTCDEGMV